MAELDRDVLPDEPVDRGDVRVRLEVESIARIGDIM